MSKTRCYSQISKKRFRKRRMSQNSRVNLCGAPGKIRTPDLLIRSQALYPAELRALLESMAPRRWREHTQANLETQALILRNCLAKQLVGSIGIRYYPCEFSGLRMLPAGDCVSKHLPPSIARTGYNPYRSEGGKKGDNCLKGQVTWEHCLEGRHWSVGRIYLKWQQT